MDKSAIRNFAIEARKMLMKSAETEVPPFSVHPTNSAVKHYSQTECHSMKQYPCRYLKEKFMKACRTLAFYEASKNYISAAEIIENANQVKKIISLQKPYSFIPKLEQYEKMLGEANLN